MAHIVTTRRELAFSVPAEFIGRSHGYTGDLVVNEDDGGVQMGFRVALIV